MTRALIVVDVQRDFCEGGSLAVSGGAEVAQKIWDFIISDDGRVYDVVYATRDWHAVGSDNGGHFSETPDFKDTWPAHCVEYTLGAAIQPPLQPAIFDAIVDKGHDEPAYSGFQGQTCSGKTLVALLDAEGVQDVDVVGIATDYCVKATALDANGLGYRTRVILDLTAAVTDDVMPVVEDLQHAGVEVVVNVPGNIPGGAQ